MSFSLLTQAKSLELPAIQVIPIEDTATGRNYELYIKLPENYDENIATKYPVIYYSDAFWTVEFLSSTTAFQIADSILVGISWQKDIDEKLKKEVGEHASRFRDYSYTKSDDPERQKKYNFGQADKHIDFIRNDVFKYVENTYRTEPNNRSYFGYSMGGGFGTYILLSQPDTFKNYILGSPSVWRLTELESKGKIANQPLNANVFISHGTLKNEVERGKHVEAFIEVLNKRKDKSLSLTYEVIEGDHATAFPMIGVRSVIWLANLLGDKNK